VQMFYDGAYSDVLAIGDVFEREGKDLDWGVHRIACIPAGDDEASWRDNREEGEIFMD
jgi:hypothetical protein